MTPSRRSRFESAPNQVAALLSERAAAGKKQLDLTISNPTRAGIPYEEARLARALSEAAREPYDPVAFGLPEARAAVCELWHSRGVPSREDRVCLTASTSEAYHYLLTLLCDPGDDVLVPAPSYPLFEHLMRFAGVNPISYRIDYDGAFHIDLASVRERAGSRTRAIVTVTPNNPTGSILKRDELHALSQLGVPIISDEVFGDYRIAPGVGSVRTALEAEDTVVFALDGLSKSAALPQLKLAWITASGPEGMVRELMASLELIADTFLSPSGPVQHALSHLIAASATPRRAIVERIRRNDQALRRELAIGALTPLPVEGGWYAVLRLPGTRSETEWVLGLLHEHDVLVQPGWFYDFETEPFVVVSLITPESDFDEGIRRLKEYVAKNA